LIGLNLFIGETSSFTLAERTALQPRRRGRFSRDFVIRPRAFVGCKRLLGRRLAGPFRWGAGSALTVT